MSNRFTRRRFMVTAGAVATTALGSSIFNLETVWAAPVTRRNLGGMAATDPILVAYGKAIKAMKALPTANPLSWAYQAAIHRTTLPGTHIAWNTCQHGTHFFWSWHRMYLYWFERIIRKMSGDSTWALPYWDYHSPAQRTMPVPFRDSTSELYTVNRGFGWNAGTASFPASHVDPSAGMAMVDYFAGQSSIESNPHNNVHVDIGGWMGSVPTAAQDPVFFVHHSNIDRLWNLWLAQGGGRHDPLGDTAWKNTVYTFFNENGTVVHMTACDILRCAEQLNYTYEGEPTQVKEYCLKLIPFPIYYLIAQVLIQWPGPPVELTGKEVSIPIDIAQMRQRIEPLLENKNETLVLELNNVEAEREPGVVWEVYLGQPANTAANTESPAFLGTVTLFSAGVRSHAHGEFKPEHFTFPAKKALAAALKANQEKLQLVFVPTGPLIDGKPSHPKVQAPVRIGGVSIAIAHPQKQKEGEVPERPR
jgi:tyrosinase